MTKIHRNDSFPGRADDLLSLLPGKILWRLLRHYLGLGYAQADFQPLFERIYEYVLGGMNIGGGACVGTSGEQEVIRYVVDQYSSKSDGPVIFDVGANQGQYTSQVIDIIGHQRGRVHCFEPSRTTYAGLVQRVGSYANVIPHNIGLGDAEQSRTLYSNAGLTGLASLYSRRLDHMGIGLDQEEQISVKTLDSFCAEQGIKEIHFLKIDVEGHELAVLRGGHNMIETGAIKFIQFEFGGCNIDSRTFLQDFFYLLSRNYVLHRIVKNGLIPLPKYQEFYEVFLTTNYLAIHHDLIL